MIINNLLIKLKEQNNEIIEETRTALLGMKGKIEVLRDVQVEVDIRHGESSYDILLITKFASMEDMDSYLVHPVHVEVSKYILKVMDTGAAVCYKL
ncbi:Dabb family protein [Desulfosporosinus fructosivorans]